MRFARFIARAGFAAVAILLAGLGCAVRHAPRPEGPPSAADVPSVGEDRARVAAWERDLAEREASLHGVRVTGEVDCPRGCELVGEICELADRVCTIAARHPEDLSLSDHCGQDRRRCARARTSLEGACACAPRAANAAPRSTEGSL